MKLVTVGLNHKTAPIEIREKLAFSNDSLKEGLRRLSDAPAIEEVLILSTCNRVEIYAVTKQVSRATAEIKDFLAHFHHIPLQDLNPHFYIHEHEEAILHGLRVASGLDSMVVGETQILGQMKEAYREACEAGSTASWLNRYYHRVFNVAKKIRTETEIASRPVSVSYVAVMLAKRIFGSLDSRKALLVGAGKMSELAAKHLKSQGSPEIWVANRSFEKAAEIAKECQGHPLHFDEFFLTLPLVDVVITSTASQEYILKPEHIHEAMRLRKNRPMFLIDIAVPRNIDPAINRIFNVYLYDLDDLQSVVTANLKERQLEAQKAEAIVGREAREFITSLQTLSVTPTIHRLLKKIDQIRRRELEKALSRLKNLTPEQQETLEAFSASLVNKILHDPLLALKTEQTEWEEAEGHHYTKLIQKLFRLDEIAD